MPPVQLYSEFIAGQSSLQRARGFARDAALLGLSVTRSFRGEPGCIRFPFYHHVFDDERADFARQLDALRRIGDFIALDDAVECLTSERPISGSFVCVTFDDGYLNNATNAMPILLDKKVPAAFFLATRFINTHVDRDRELLLSFFEGGRRLVPFLSWEDCRRMAAAGMTIGSHGVNHVPLATLDEARALAELTDSKAVIERELGQPCHHFGAPFGKPDEHYLPARDPHLAVQAGYRSFLTTLRGPSSAGDSALAMRRDHLIAGWGNHQVRYFLGS